MSLQSALGLHLRALVANLTPVGDVESVGAAGVDMSRVLTIITLLLAALTLASCDSSNGGTSSGSESKPCGTTWTQVESGQLKKYKSYVSSSGACLVDNLALSKLESTTFNWAKNNVQCTSVGGFSSRTLVSSGNAYDYRNSKVYLDLNASTGVFRRLVLSEDKRGNATYAKLQGCFFYREGTGADAIFGRQLFFDTTNISKLITSQTLDAPEIFKINESSPFITFTRWDDSRDWSFKMCPYLSVPYGNCLLLQQDGNDFYWPTLTAQQMADLLQEALLISKEYSYVDTPKTNFDSLWANVANSRKDIDYSDLKYFVIPQADVPFGTDQSWMQFLRGERPWMPTSVTTAPSVGPICHTAYRTVALSGGGTARILGEVCYTLSGGYEWTAN